MQVRARRRGSGFGGGFKTPRFFGSSQDGFEELLVVRLKMIDPVLVIGF